jgi:hypothetical protein
VEGRLSAGRRACGVWVLYVCLSHRSDSWFEQAEAAAETGKGRQPQYPVGWDPRLDKASTTSNNNKKKKKQQQQQQQQQQQEAKTPTAAPEPPNAVVSASVELVAAGVAALGVSPPVEGEVLARRVKALQKKLRQIGELEARVCDGGSLTSEQREKLGRKAAVEEELRALHSKA